MASSFNTIDDLIRDYFNYRGLTTSLRTFENELSKSQIGQFRADRVVEQLTIYIHQFFLDAFVEYWSSIEQRILSNAVLHSHQLTSFLSKIRTNLYRCYLVHAIQSSRTDKVHEFFDQLSRVLQSSTDWAKEWFALPYIRNPEENSTFQLYFTKQWSDLFWISLQNFLSMAFYHMTPPKICAFEDNSSQSFGNLISQQTNTTNKSLLPLSARIDSSMNQFSEVLDEIQSPINPSIPETPTRPSNLTIISKFRNSFLPMNKHSSSQNRSTSSNTSKTASNQLTTESSSGNQIILSNEESTSTRIRSTSSLIIPSSTYIRSKTSPSQSDETHLDNNGEKLVHLTDLRHHSNTVISCKFNSNLNIYSTLDNQGHVKIWSANENFNILTSFNSRSTTTFLCQSFDTQEARLYLGTSASTIKVLSVSEKRIIDETIIDPNYPRIVQIHPYPNQNRLFASMTTTSRSSNKDAGRIRTGRMTLIDLNTWTVERTFTDNEENFVTTIDFQTDRQILVLGFNDGKVSLYDVRSNIIVDQKQQHTRFVQQTYSIGDDFYSIGNDNLLVKRNFSMLADAAEVYALPYSAVGPFSSSTSPTSIENSSLSPSNSNNNTNQFFPMTNVFDFDPFNNDRLITCSMNHGRFYNLSTSNEETKLKFAKATNLASSCVHWNKDRDICLISTWNGLIQLYQRNSRSSM